MNDKDLEPSIQGLMIVANCLNLAYNIPQVVHTYRKKSTKDFSIWFLIMRFVVNALWVVYGGVIESALVIVNNGVNIIATIFLFYYKVLELIEIKKLKNLKKSKETKNETVENINKTESIEVIQEA